MYAAVGVGYNIKVNGMAPTAEALPHLAFWRDLRALIFDGMTFAKAASAGVSSRGKVGGSPGEGSSGLDPLVAVDAKKKEKKEKKEKKAKQGKDKTAAPAPATASNTSRTEAEHRALELPLAAPSTTATLAGGGGRWVHVPA